MYVYRKKLKFLIRKITFVIIERKEGKTLLYKRYIIHGFYVSRDLWVLRYDINGISFL